MFVMDAHTHIHLTGSLAHTMPLHHTPARFCPARVMLCGQYQQPGESPALWRYIERSRKKEEGFRCVDCGEVPHCSGIRGISCFFCLNPVEGGSATIRAIVTLQ